MLFNERKLQTLEFFAQRDWTRPAIYAGAVNFYPVRSAWSYLRRLHRWRYLRRGWDARGRLVYKLGSNGARFLLRNARV